MSFTDNYQEVSHHHDFDREAARKEVIRVTVILTVITIVELILGFVMMGVHNEFMRHVIKGAICVFMLAKAFYIVAYFMHLKHEVRNLIMTLNNVFERKGHYLMIEKAGLYWHFVDLVWVFVFTCFYLI